MAKTVFAVLLLALIVHSGAWAYELPEVIVRIEGEQPPEGAESAPYSFGTDFCCVGDVNGDGYNDLLVNHAPFETGYGDAVFANQVELFYGGDPMDDEPDFIYSVGDTTIGLGRWIKYLGHLDDTGDCYVAIQAMVFKSSDDPFAVWEVWLYRLGENLSNEPSFRISLDYDVDWWDNEVGYSIDAGRNDRPCDLNGDGYDDLITKLHVDDVWQFMIFFGGAEFDTIPDWVVSDSLAGYTNEYSSGCDVNSDGFDDLLMFTGSTNFPVPVPIERYRLFLGGEPMDTIPVFEFGVDDFQGKEVRYGFSMLPDVNGDGYDDMGFNYYQVPRERWDVDGCLLLFGSNQPDKAPDLDLEGHTNPFSLEGEIVGGDFNGDGFGDVIFINPLGNQLEGEFNFNFGSRWIDNDADYVVNTSDAYDLPYLGDNTGAVGDYNGDGVKDFVAQSWTARDAATVVVLAGNHDWEVNVPETESKECELSLETNPNPFNTLTSIRYEVPSAGLVDLTIYDLGGRKVASLTSGGVVSAQVGSLEWSWDISGVYFAVLRSTNGSGAVQTRSCKLVCIR
jgi:hypothetical protein